MGVIGAVSQVAVLKELTDLTDTLSDITYFHDNYLVSYLFHLLLLHFFFYSFFFLPFLLLLIEKRTCAPQPTFQQSDMCFCTTVNYNNYNNAGKKGTLDIETPFCSIPACPAR